MIDVGLAYAMPPGSVQDLVGACKDFSNTLLVVLGTAVLVMYLRKDSLGLLILRSIALKCIIPYSIPRNLHGKHLMSNNHELYTPSKHTHTYA